MTRQPNPKRAARIRALILASIMLLVGGKWYFYVAHAESPYDDFGSGLNAMMPGPINRIGCDMLQRRFGNVPIPPRGCDAGGHWL